MSNPSLKLMVVTHKPYWMPSEDMYLPVIVGPGFDGGITGAVRDSDGADNISAKNGNYCELTALYWAWRNLDVDYLGLTHYRRHFKGHGEREVITEPEVRDLMDYCHVVVPRRRNYFIESVYSHYSHAHHVEPLDRALGIVRQGGHAYAAAADRVMNRKWLYLYNMFIMSSDLTRAYCSWLFPILAEVEASIDTTGYDAYEARVYGFLSERLWNVWLEAQRLRVQEVPVLNLEPQRWGNKIARFLKRKYSGGPAYA